MCLTWSKWVQAYKIGLLHYVESPEHGCDPEVCHLHNAVQFHGVLHVQSPQSSLTPARRRAC